MADPTILPVKPGTLSNEDKDTLRSAGVVVIEHDDPSELRLLKPSSELSSGDMLLAAMRGVMMDRDAKRVFAENIHKFLEAAHEVKGGKA